MAEMYAVEVLAKKDATVTIALRKVHPDAARVGKDQGLAFYLIRESAEPTTPLGSTVVKDVLWKPDWLRANVWGYVDKVKVAGSDAAKRTHIAVTVTDPAWIEHLTVGQKWDSAAYPGQWYDYIDPVLWKGAAGKAAAPAAKPAAKSAAKKPAAKKPAAKKPAKKSVAKKPAAKKPATKPVAKKPAAKKPAKKPVVKKPAAKKPAAKKKR